MAPARLIIPKIAKQVKLWVHPDGLVLGSLFVQEQNLQQQSEEEPQQVLNQDKPFVVLLQQQPDELRFYNRNSIVRVMYTEKSRRDSREIQVIACQLVMMDGALLKGEIRESLPEDHARLFDYLNRENCRFIKLFVGNEEVCLVNKSYINHVTIVTSN